MKKALHIIYNILLYLFLILGMSIICIILRSSYRSDEINWLFIGLGCALYVISGALIILELLSAATAFKPDSCDVRHKLQAV